MLVDLKQSLKPDALLAMKIEGSANWQVNQNSQYRWLMLNNTVQSVMSLTEDAALLFPHQQPLLSLLTQLKQPVKVLEVGLGGGSNLRHVKTYYPCFNYKVIEPSMAVIELFQTHFNPLNYPVHYVVDTGLAYLKSSSAQYDLIISDIFSHQASSMNLLTLSYCQQLSEHLTQGGYLYLNFMPETSFEMDLLQAHFFGLGLTLIKTEKISGYRNCILIYQQS